MLARRVTALAVPLSAVLVALGCTGEDPDAPPLAVPEAGSSGGEDAGGPADGGSGGDGGGGSRHPECPSTVPVPCGADPSYGNPALHLDACKLGEDERRLGEWAAVTGQVLGTAPAGGGLFCRAGLNARKAVVFAGSRGFVLANAGAMDYDPATGFVVAVVMRYEQRANVPGSIVFQRSSPVPEQGFPGPALVANIAYAQAFGGTALNPDTSWRGLGLQLRFGPRAAGSPGATDGVAAATDTHRTGPLVVLARLSGEQLELRVNGKLEATTTLPQGFTATGAGQPLQIGHTSQAENELVGAIGEMLFYNGDAPTELEDGLLAKWGVQRAL